MTLITLESMRCEGNEVSIHEVLVWKHFEKNAGRWFSINELKPTLGDKMVPRTIRNHANKLASLGILDMAEVFPGHRFRLSEKASKRNAGYLQRLQVAAEVLGVQ